MKKQFSAQTIPVQHFVVGLLGLFLAGADLHAGVVLRLYYENVRGDFVADLTNHPTFPSKPTKAEVVSQFLEKLEESGENYGTWTRGYIEAPETGPYLFWLASDNNSELWISTNHLAAGLRKVVANDHHVERRQYLAKPSQQSAPVNLVRSEKYYFELFHKEGTFGDHISVGWQRPDGTIERPMPVTHLLPFPVDESYVSEEKAPGILTEYFQQPIPALTNVSAVEGASATFSVNFEATQPASIQWFQNKKPIPGATLSTYTLTNVQLINDVDLFSVVISNRLGQATAEAVLSVSQEATVPAVLSAFRFDDSLLLVFSRPVQPATATNLKSYALNEGTIRSAAIGHLPNTVILKTSPLQIGRIYTVTVSNVKEASDAQNTIPYFSPVVVEEGLQVHLKFNELTPTNSVVDSSGYGNFAVFTGGPVINPEGVIGGAMEFDGKDDFGKLPIGFADHTNGITFAVWVNPAAATKWARFIDFGNGESVDNILFARQGESDGLVFEAYNGNGQSQKVIASHAIELKKWQHFAVSMDGRCHVWIYKNGELITEGDTLVPNNVMRTENFIGRSNWTQDALYVGGMDDLRIYQRPLNAAEIKALANSPSLLK